MNDAAMFATVLYGILDRRSREFIYVRAGHEMPIVLDADGHAVDPTPGGGQPLGILPEPALDEHRVVLPEGGLLVLYTDGATDAINEMGTAFGWDRFAAVIDAHRQAPAQDICDQIMNAITEYRGATPPEDDITLVTVRILA